MISHTKETANAPRRANPAFVWRPICACLVGALLLLSGCGPAPADEPPATATPDASLAIVAATPTEAPLAQPDTPAPTEAAPTAPPPTEVPTAAAEAVANESAEPVADEPVTEQEAAPVPTAAPVATAPPAPPADGEYAFSEQGVVSFISDSLHGNPTASGEPYNKDAMVAAHKTLPFGTEVRVTNLNNNRVVQVVVVDRLPHNNPHLIDVSSAAGQQLDLAQSGNADALVEWNE